MTASFYAVYPALVETHKQAMRHRTFDAFWMSVARLTALLAICGNGVAATGSPAQAARPEVAAERDETYVSGTAHSVAYWQFRFWITNSGVVHAAPMHTRLRVYELNAGGWVLTASTEADIADLQPGHKSRFCFARLRYEGELPDAVPRYSSRSRQYRFHFEIDEPHAEIDYRTVRAAASRVVAGEGAW